MYTTCIARAHRVQRMVREGIGNLETGVLDTVGLSCLKSPGNCA